MKKYIAFSILVLIFSAVFFILHSKNTQEETVFVMLPEPSEKVITFSVSPIFINQALIKYPIAPSTKPDNRIKGVIVPHHDLASDLIAEAVQKIAQTQQPKRIILIGPNHSDAGGNSVLTTEAIWQMDNLKVYPDTKVVQELIDRRVAGIDDEVLSHEHSIFTILPFIKYYFPEAKIVPLILSSKLHVTESVKLAQELQPYLDEDSLVIASIDFSHYLPSDITPEKDRYTKELILHRQYEGIASLRNDHIDSPASLVTILKAMDLKRASSVAILRNTHSGAILNQPIYSSTSYFTILFSL